MIEAFITNAGKYAEGELTGEWLKFPTATEAVQALLSKIGVDGARYQEYIATDYHVGILGLVGLGEIADIDELNYFASLLDGLSFEEIDRFEAAAIRGDYSGSVKDLINLVQNPDCYEHFNRICDDEELGRYLIDELETAKIPDWIENYFDYDGYGRDYRLNNGGIYTATGFVYRNHKVDFIEHYSGRDDIPDEYRVFAYPAPLERRAEMDEIKIPIAGSPDVTELLNLLEANHMPGAKDLLATINQVSAMEKHLAAMVMELGNMRRELAEAQRLNHPIQNAMQKAVAIIQGNVLDIRDKLNGIKHNIIVGCKNALATVEAQIGRAHV